MHIIFYGPEGSGKGTQAKLVSEKFHYPIFTSGDLVREAAATDKSSLGDVCRKALNEGAYVPDAEMFTLWKQRLSRPDAQADWIMDGFPRNEDQAVFLDEKFAAGGHAVDAVFYLKLSEEESVRRLMKRARPLHPGSSELHDSPERIAHRLRVYKVGEQPLLAYYEKQGVLITINGEQTPDEVQLAIVRHLPT